MAGLLGQELPDLPGAVNRASLLVMATCCVFSACVIAVTVAYLLCACCVYVFMILVCISCCLCMFIVGDGNCTVMM